MALGTLNGGYHFLTDTSVHYFTTFNSGFWDNTQRGVLFDLDGNERWVATPAAGLLRQFGDWYGGTWFQYSTFNSNLPSNALVDLARSSDGSLWLATQVAGLVRRFPNESYQSFTDANSGLPVNTLNRVKVADDDAIWVALFDPTLDVQESVRPEGLRITPSVNEGSFRVSGFESSSPLTWAIHDQLGRSVLNGVHGTASELRFDGLDLRSGAYFLILEGQGISRTGRFLVH
ncbi:MAG TPA: T9SS type A sorting domain-containing protein [Flavobacteriales bacterium]|nr:T9SS type A sorting domain-containing protein [Flavobacteriales bacterium]